MNIQNIFTNLPEDIREEFFETMINDPSFRLERIVSHGQSTPKGQWYDQEQDEWVILLKGSAGLILEGEPEPIILTPGDHLFLPAHKQHQVEWTDENEPTIWLALHYQAAQ